MDYTTSDYKRTVSLLHLKGGFQGWQRSSSAMFHCPLGHSKGNTPSLKVDFVLGRWYCHSCKEGGHLSTLVRRTLHTSMPELLGIDADMETLGVQYQYVEPERPSEYPIVDVRGVPIPWSSSPEAMAYLDYRGILPMVATRANIQYMDEGYANGLYLDNRLMIPIYDDRGRAINWEARDVTFQHKIKCMYAKGAVKPLYEWYKLNKKKPVFLLEGLIKTLVARSDSFFANSTTSFGSAINPWQLELLNEIPYLIAILDKDPEPFFNDKLGKMVYPSAGKDQGRFLRENYKGHLEIWNINHPLIKDVDEIPTKLDMTVRDFRNQGGFISAESLKSP